MVTRYTQLQILLTFSVAPFNFDRSKQRNLWDNVSLELVLVRGMRDVGCEE